MIMRGYALKHLLAIAGVAAALLVTGATPRGAAAQSRMRFESTSEESARAFDERVAEKRRAERAAAAAPSTPSAPSAGMPSERDAEPPVPPEPGGSSGDIVRIGSNINIDEGQTVDGDVVVFGADAHVDGHVRGNVSVTRGDLYLGSTARVDGDVLCFGGEIHEDDGATVRGQRVTGLQRRSFNRERIREHIRHDIQDVGFRKAEKVARRVTYLLVWLLLAWTLTRFASERTGRALDTLRRESMASFGFGFGLMLLLVPSLVALALVATILCITIIGIPVAIGVLFAYFGLLIVVGGWGYVVGVSALGERFAMRGGHRPTLMRSAITGVLAVQGTMVLTAVFGNLPIIGWMASMLFVIALVTFSIVTLLGIGALIRSKLGQGPEGAWWPPNRLFGPLHPAAPAGYPPPPPPTGYVPAPYPAPPAPPAPPASVAGTPPTWTPPAPPAPPQSYAPPGYAPPPAPPAPPPGYIPPASEPPPVG
jgi:hypothetical protein